YAAKRKVSPQYVSKLCKEGVLQLVNGKIDPELADRQISDFTAQIHESPGPKAKGPVSDDSLASWRKRELQVKTGLKKLEYERERGLLINKDELLFSLKDLFLGIRGQILSIPTKLKVEMIQTVEKGCNVKVPLDVQSKLTAIMHKECQDVLLALSTWQAPGATKTKKRR
ncbi:MAG: hypothetical protein A3K22_04975, partial [Deltaproteobacteria bacterium RBG_16_42_7]